MKRLFWLPLALALAALVLDYAPAPAQSPFYPAASPCPLYFPATIGVGSTGNNGACPVAADTLKAARNTLVASTALQIAPPNGLTSYYVGDWSCGGIGTVVLDCELFAGTGALCGTNTFVVDDIIAGSSTNLWGFRDFDQSQQMPAGDGLCILETATTLTSSAYSVHEANR